VRQPNHPTKLRWPLSIHSLMVVWNGLYLKKANTPLMRIKVCRGTGALILCMVWGIAAAVTRREVF